jgi:RNA polymerase sigma-70 factor (ECF subfamily)
VLTIVRRAQAGDDLAFADLYVRLFDRVRRYLMMAVKDEQDAQELAQDVFAKLLTALPTYDPARGAFSDWLFSLVRRRAVDHLRKANRSNAVDPIALGRYGPCPEDLATLRERFDPSLDLAAIVDALPETQRRVVVLRFAFDFTPSEIADVVGASPEAVRQCRALRTIAARLEEQSDREPAERVVAA